MNAQLSEKFHRSVGQSPSWKIDSENLLALKCKARTLLAPGKLNSVLPAGRTTGIYRHLQDDRLLRNGLAARPQVAGKMERNCGQGRG